MKKILNNLFLWLIKEPQQQDESVMQIASNGVNFRTYEPKRPSNYLAWVRWQQRFNKVRIQL